MTDVIRVLIADDTAIAREGLRRLLADAQDVTIVGDARTIYEAVQLTEHLRPDVLLMDLKWSGDDTAGIGAIEYLTRAVPECRILAITVYDHLISRAREAGAHLAITKDFSPDQLHSHIRALYRATGLPPTRVSVSTEWRLVEPLTEREGQVLQLLAEGMSDREIGERLTISENTAKNHVAAVLSKLGARNRTQAVVMALKGGLLDV